MTLLKDLIDLYFLRFQGSPGDEQNKNEREIVRKYINIGWKDVYRAALWEYRKRHGHLLITPNYTTGTCTVTAYDETNEFAARTVTFSGSTLTQKMVGRYFQVKGSSNWHRIERIDGSTAYLDTPILTVNGGGLTFKIWQRFHYLKSEVDVITDFGAYTNNDILIYQTDKQLSSVSGGMDISGDPTDFSVFGIDPYSDVEYTTGTVSITLNSNIAAFTGSNLITNAQEGDILVISNVNYYIKRIETDTRAILHNYASQAITNSTFRILKNNPLGIQAYPQTSNYAILPYTYCLKPFDLLNEDYDRTAFPDQFDPAIISRAEMLRRKDKNPGGTEWIAVAQTYAAELEGLKQRKAVIKPRYIQFSPTIPRTMPGRG